MKAQGADARRFEEWLLAREVVVAAITDYAGWQNMTAIAQRCRDNMLDAPRAVRVVSAEDTAHLVLIALGMIKTMSLFFAKIN
jgi:hypothetical protein